MPHFTPQELVERFAFFDDWEDRYAYLIELGRGLPPLSAEEQREEYKVRGCTSQVWLVPDRAADGTLSLRGQSDAQLVQGLVAILLGLYNGLTPHQALTLEIDATLQQLDLKSFLSPSRSNGLYAMVEKIQQLSKAMA